MATASKAILSSLGAGFVHTKSLLPYATRDGEIQRCPVTPDKVPWKVEWQSYSPILFNDKNLKGQVWADPDILENKNATLRFNIVDGKINRESFLGPYNLDSNGLPLNPVGRTGMKGRGRLGRWGPNHAADPIVTRWKRGDDGKECIKNGAKLLQFVAICRKDNKEWAIPGGMVDAGENVSITLRREFSEEAMAGFSPKERDQLSGMLNEFFSNGTLVYRGYVDDPRNTDNAWMETVAVNFHDDKGTSVAKFPLQAGDDAGAVAWKDVGPELQLYASHKTFIEAVAKSLDAYW